MIITNQCATVKKQTNLILEHIGQCTSGRSETMTDIGGILVEYSACIALDNLLQKNKIQREIKEIEKEPKHDLRM